MYLEEEKMSQTLHDKGVDKMFYLNNYQIRKPVFKVFFGNLNALVGIKKPFDGKGNVQSGL